MNLIHILPPYLYKPIVHRCVSIPSDFLPPAFYTKILYSLLISPDCYMYRPLHPLTLINVVKFGEECALCSLSCHLLPRCSQYSSVQYPVLCHSRGVLAMTMKIVVFWHVTLCCLEVIYRRSKKDPLLTYSRILTAVATDSYETSVGIASQKTASFTFRLCYCVIVREQNLPELSFHPCTPIQPSTFPVTLQSTTHQTNHPHFQSLSSPPRIKPTIHISSHSTVHHSSNQPSTFPVTLQSTTHQTNHPHFQSVSSPPLIKPTIHISSHSPVHHSSKQPSTFPVTLQSTTHQTNHPHFQSLYSPPLIKPTSYLPTCLSLMTCSSCGTTVTSFTYNMPLKSVGSSDKVCLYYFIACYMFRLLWKGIIKLLFLYSRDLSYLRISIILLGCNLIVFVYAFVKLPDLLQEKPKYSAIM